MNALLGTANLILREVEEHEPRAVVLCFGPDAADYRVELFDGYHARAPRGAGHARAAVRRRRSDFFEAFGWTVAVSDNARGRRPARLVRHARDARRAAARS